MIFGAAGQALSMAVLAGTTSRVSNEMGIAAAVFLFVFNTFFAIGWLGMTWLYPAEITPLSIRAPANAISTNCDSIPLTESEATNLPQSGEFGARIRE